MNRAVIVGRLTRDPDLRYTSNGHAVANFTVAVNRPFRNEQGEQEADFINCVAWRKQAENLANYMRKGSRVGVDGRIQTRSYDNDQGQKVFVTEVLAESITFLESRSESQQTQQGQANPYQQQAQTSYEQYGAGQQQQTPSNPFAHDGEKINVSDDELPF